MKPKGPKWLQRRRARRNLEARITSYKNSAVIHTAVALGIPDLLFKEPQTSAELSRSLGAHERSLARFLNGLVAAGLCTRDGECFSLTAMGSLLCREAHGSLYGPAILGAESYKAWGSLKESILTGETAYHDAFGSPAWEHRKRQPELDELLNRAFLEGAARVGRELAEQADFSRVATITDVGGGYGALLAMVLERHPACRGIVMDQPHLAEGAERYLRDRGLSDRCIFHGGDFLAEVPSGTDRYLIKSVLHNWGDEACVTLLSHCRKAMSPEGRVLVIERQPGKDPDQPDDAMLDLQMMAVTGGRERTQGELEGLFRAAGLALVGTIDLPSGFRVLETARS